MTEEDVRRIVREEMAVPAGSYLINPLEVLRIYVPAIREFKRTGGAIPAPPEDTKP